jgi:hypothetical protein
MKRRHLIILAFMAAFALSSIANAASALGAERLWLNELMNVIAPVGTMWFAPNVGEMEFKASVLTVKCTTAESVGDIIENEPLMLKAYITNDTITGCKDSFGNGVTIATSASAPSPWVLKWTATKTLALTSIEGTVEDTTLKQDCIFKNSTTAFNLKWANAKTNSTLTATKQPVTLSAVPGKTCGATSGEITDTYSVAKVNGAEGNLWIG